MHRPYRSKDGLKVEGLTVLYAADHEGVMLIWSNDWMTYLPAKGDLDLDLGFKKGAAVGQSWGTRRLLYDLNGGRAS